MCQGCVSPFSVGLVQPPSYKFQRLYLQLQYLVFHVGQIHEEVVVNQGPSKYESWLLFNTHMDRLGGDCEFVVDDVYIADQSSFG